MAGAGVCYTGKITGALRCCGHDGSLRLSLRVALAFVIGEEEIFVPPDRAADRGSKLIQVQRLSRRGEEVTSIEDVVTDKLVNVAMKFIAA